MAAAGTDYGVCFHFSICNPIRTAYLFILIPLHGARELFKGKKTRKLQSQHLNTSALISWLRSPAYCIPDCHIRAPRIIIAGPHPTCTSSVAQDQIKELCRRMRGWWSKVRSSYFSRKLTRFARHSLEGRRNACPKRPEKFNFRRFSQYKRRIIFAERPATKCKTTAARSSRSWSFAGPARLDKPTSGRAE
jgi:hypothetical protein